MPGINSPIVLLEGVFTAEQLALAAHLQFDVVVHEAQQLALLESRAAGPPLVAWLKVDTGNEPAWVSPASSLKARWRAWLHCPAWCARFAC